MVTETVKANKAMVTVNFQNWKSKSNKGTGAKKRPIDRTQKEKATQYLRFYCYLGDTVD
jgi:hypothetical protein